LSRFPGFSFMQEKSFHKALIVSALVCLLPGCAMKAFDEGDLQSESDLILYQVADLRGLDVLEPVPVQVMERRELRPLLEEQLESELSDEDIVNEARLYHFLGLLPHGYDLKKAMLDIYEKEVAAFCDPEKDEIVVITPWRASFFAPVLLLPGSRESLKDLVLSHELIHALEDQHFHLEQYSHKTCRNQDHLLAIQAVEEGSAVLFSILYLFEGLPAHIQPPWKKIIADFEKKTQKQAVRTLTPEIIIAPMLFTYKDGLEFIHAVYEERGIEGINALYEDGSLSTENILHPDEYLAGLELPVEIEFTDTDLNSELEGWDKLCEDTMGEFGIDLVLNYYLPPKVARKAADGWGGDRYGLWESPGGGGRLLFIWNSVWDTQADAIEFHEALLEVLHVKYPDLKKIGMGVNGEEFAINGNDVDVALIRSENNVFLFEARRLSP
jgi:hypothetical protein